MNPMAEVQARVTETIEPGERVEVRSRFEGGWTRGFEVECAKEGQYQIRRLSDNAVLPSWFVADDVRRERRRQLWWA